MTDMVTEATNTSPPAYDSRVIVDEQIPSREDNHP